MERTLERLNRVAQHAEELSEETERLRRETTEQIHRATREFRILFTIMVIMLAGILVIGFEAYIQAQANYEVLEILEEFEASRGENLETALDGLAEALEDQTSDITAEMERQHHAQQETPR